MKGHSIISGIDESPSGIAKVSGWKNLIVLLPLLIVTITMLSFPISAFFQFSPNVPDSVVDTLFLLTLGPAEFIAILLLCLWRKRLNIFAQIFGWLGVVFGAYFFFGMFLYCIGVLAPP